RLGGSVGDAPLLAVLLIPLGMIGGELGCVFGHLLEEKFARRKNREAMVAEDAEVELAAVDVFLDQDIAVELLMDVAHALEGFGLIAREGGFADAVGGFLAH